jgi:hypothetical protein
MAFDAGQFETLVAAVEAAGLTVHVIDSVLLPE